MEVYFVFRKAKSQQNYHRFSYMNAVIRNDDGSIIRVDYGKYGFTISKFDSMKPITDDEIWLQLTHNERAIAQIRAKLMDGTDRTFALTSELKNVPLNQMNRYMTTPGYFARALNLEMHLIYSIDHLHQVVSNRAVRVLSHG